MKDSVSSRPQEEEGTQLTGHLVLRLDEVWFEATRGLGEVGSRVASRAGTARPTALSCFEASVASSRDGIALVDPIFMMLFAGAAHDDLIPVQELAVERGDHSLHLLRRGNLDERVRSESRPGALEQDVDDLDLGYIAPGGEVRRDPTEFDGEGEGAVEGGGWRGEDGLHVEGEGSGQGS